MSLLPPVHFVLFAFVFVLWHHRVPGGGGGGGGLGCQTVFRHTSYCQRQKVFTSKPLLSRSCMFVLRSFMVLPSLQDKCWVSLCCIWKLVLPLSPSSISHVSFSGTMPLCQVSAIWYTQMLETWNAPGQNCIEFVFSSALWIFKSMYITVYFFVSTFFSLHAHCKSCTNGF